MISLSIISLAIAATVVTGHLPYTADAHHIEAQRILQTNAYRYKGTNVIGAHSDRVPRLFERLPEIQVGDPIQFDGKEYSVFRTAVIPETRTSILNSEDLVLFTCLPDSRKRFVVFAK